MKHDNGGRLETGVPGLDVILNGGLIPGSVFIVQGAPGAGKTILANQICFHHAQTGDRALYVTLLAESHDRLLGHLARLTFFDPRRVPESIYFISGFDTLSRDGLKGILHLLRSESRSRQASLIILDGLFALEETAQSAKEFRKFINDLTTLSALIGCTVLLLTNNSRGAESVEYTMVDGWIELETEQVGPRAARSLRILKYRGSGFVDGRHEVVISGDGMRVLPRIEALVDDTVPPWLGAHRLTTGVTGLDRMLGGGLLANTATLLAGPAGVGKTTLGLHFLAGCSAEEPGLLFSFYDAAEQLAEHDGPLAERLQSLLAADHLATAWHAPTEQRLDALAHSLIEAVRRRRVKRLLVDGVDGFAQSAVDPDRLVRFMAALTALLRREGVTVVYTVELPELLEAGGRIPYGISSVAQNIVLLRYLERDAELRRSIVVLKARSRDCDRRIRELRITPEGAVVGEALAPAATGAQTRST